MAQEHRARLTLLRVVEGARAYTEEQEEKINIQRMKEFVPAESENWCKVWFRVAFGAAAEEILEEARDIKAGLVVMGAKARKTLAGHRPATVAYKVVTKAKAPVLTVRG